MIKSFITSLLFIQYTYDYDTFKPSRKGDILFTEFITLMITFVSYFILIGLSSLLYLTLTTVDHTEEQWSKLSTSIINMLFLYVLVTYILCRLHSIILAYTSRKIGDYLDKSIKVGYGDYAKIDKCVDMKTFMDFVDFVRLTMNGNIIALSFSRVNYKEVGIFISLYNSKTKSIKNIFITHKYTYYDSKFFSHALLSYLGMIYYGIILKQLTPVIIRCVNQDTKQDSLLYSLSKLYVPLHLNLSLVEVISDDINDYEIEKSDPMFSSDKKLKKKRGLEEVMEDLDV